MNDVSSKKPRASAPLVRGSVVLFPLCDSRGDLSRVLNDAKQEPGTRADALIFAWLLDLPPSMSARGAACAVLSVLRAGKRKNLTGRQKALLRELGAIVAEGDPYRKVKVEGATPGRNALAPTWKAVDDTTKRNDIRRLRTLKAREGLK